MDNKQAIKELKQIKQNHIDLNYRFRHLYDDYMVALDKAIASLEAWDKVIEDINKLIQGDNGVELIQVGEKRALGIIEKCKKEIEE